MTDAELKGRLTALLRERSVRFGRFVLASGKESDFYVDARQTTLHAEGAWVIGELVRRALRPEVLGVGGMAVGADPVGAATAVASWRAGRPVHAFIVRKEAKAHGMLQWVEGRANLPDGTPVCVVEDTSTTGQSLLQAVDRCVAEGLVVAQVLTVVDRGEGAAERLAAAGHTLQWLVTRADLEAPG